LSAVLPLGDDVLFSSSLAQASRDIGFAINIGSEDHVPPFCYGHVCIEQVSDATIFSYRLLSYVVCFLMSHVSSGEKLIYIIFLIYRYS
jgi:hypothetical protein